MTMMFQNVRMKSQSDEYVYAKVSEDNNVNDNIFVQFLHLMQTVSGYLAGRLAYMLRTSVQSNIAPTLPRSYIFESSISCL